MERQAMKLLIDIGNTNTTMVVCEGKRPLKKYFIHTSKDEISARSFRRMLSAYLPGIDRAVVVSVVPKFLRTMKNVLKKVLPGANVQVVGKDVKVPVRNRYANPAQVGQDRLVISYAAMARSRPPLIVVDFGTAVTLDYVNGKGEYEGGLIFPGIRLSLKSLVKNAALLPKIHITPAKGIVGRSTRDSMNNGLIHGYAAMCDGLIDKMRAKYGKGVKVIATGGDALLISRFSRRINRVKEGLIFEGLNEL
jgi:type III pantothenate kinase